MHNWQLAKGHYQTQCVHSTAQKMLSLKFSSLNPTKIISRRGDQVKNMAEWSPAMTKPLYRESNSRSIDRRFLPTCPSGPFTTVLFLQDANPHFGAFTWKMYIVYMVLWSVTKPSTGLELNETWSQLSVYGDQKIIHKTSDQKPDRNVSAICWSKRKTKMESLAILTVARRSWMLGDRTYACVAYTGTSRGHQDMKKQLWIFCVHACILYMCMWVGEVLFREEKEGIPSAGSI